MHLACGRDLIQLGPRLFRQSSTGRCSHQRPRDTIVEAEQIFYKLAENKARPKAVSDFLKAVTDAVECCQRRLSRAWGACLVSLRLIDMD